MASVPQACLDLVGTLGRQETGEGTGQSLPLRRSLPPPALLTPPPALW